PNEDESDAESLSSSASRSRICVHDAASSSESGIPPTRSLIRSIRSRSFLGQSSATPARERHELRGVRPSVRRHVERELLYLEHLLGMSSEAMSRRDDDPQTFCKRRKFFGSSQPDVERLVQR